MEWGGREGVGGCDHRVSLKRPGLMIHTMMWGGLVVSTPRGVPHVYDFTALGLSLEKHTK